MILGEFAVNPNVITDWKDLKVITMNFGFEHGAVISSFPKAWLKSLQQKAKSELQEVEYSRVVERLRAIKDDVLIKSGREFKPECDWIQNSLIQQKNKPFYKIIHDGELADHPEVISFDLVDKHVFKDLREGKIKRYADSFAEVSKLLLANSKSIQFIDPYFSAKGKNGKLNEGFIKSFKAMLNVAGVFNRNNITSIQFHTSYKHSKTEVHIEGEKEMLDAHYRKLIPSGQQIEFLWWNDEGTGEIHPRYLVTEKGGIRFDIGFVEPTPIEQRESETDVSMMTIKMISLISQKYREGSSSYKVVDRHIVQGIG
mgnify:CR=1 FL=1